MEFNISPYYDDFETSGGAKDQNYVRILFRPEYAVQARELTQIQSIIQNQIKQFGNHIFKDGSPVIGGQISLDTSVKAIKLKSQFDGVDVDVNDFIGKTITTVVSSSVLAKVVAVDETQTQPTILIKYLSGTEFTAEADIITVGESVAAYATTFNVDHQTDSSAASINDGIFYVNGYFVQVLAQTIVLDPYGKTPTFRVGLEINDEIVDESSDSQLLDPSQESFNFQAPGATRYKFALDFTKRTLTSSDDSKFFELLRVENGQITKQVSYPLYSEIEKTLARRTYDESGDYTVRPFRVNFSPNANTSKFDINIEPGKAYVKGFEFETVSTFKLTTDKARDTGASNDYEIDLLYGNYVAVKNLVASSGNTSSINFTTLPEITLHSVDYANVSSTTLVDFNTTKVGTARVRNVERVDSDTFHVYLTDISTNQFSLNVSSSATTTTTFRANTPHSTVTGAYNGVEIYFPRTGETRIVTSYVHGGGPASDFTVNLPFAVAPSTGDQMILNFSRKNINSLIVADTDGYTKLSRMNVDAESKDTTGNTVIYDTNFDTMIFELPEDYVKNGSISGEYYFLRKAGDYTFTANGDAVISTSTGEEFYYGTVGSNLSTSQISDHLMLFVKDPLSSGLTKGSLFNLTTVARESVSTLKLYTGAGASFVGTVYHDVRLNNSHLPANDLRTKTLKGNSTATIRTSDSYLNAVDVLGLPTNTARLDLANGHIWFPNTVHIVKTDGGAQSLYTSDVIKIAKVYDSGNPSFAPNVSNAIDITSRFELDTGQRDHYYDHASIILKPSSQPPQGQTVVMFQYYEADRFFGHFSVDSYVNGEYANDAIPKYVSTNGTTYDLRDSLDFRPLRDSGVASSVQTKVFNESRVPKTGTFMELDYEYYLPRTDKLVLTKDKQFKVLKGEPSQFPVEPIDGEDGMTLYVINLPAFTANTNDIRTRYVDNRRYTMRDIGSLEKRIKNLEYYTLLSRVESKADLTSIFYENNIDEKEKYGILADDFSGFKVADYTNPDYLVSITDSELTAYKVYHEANLAFNSAASDVGSNYQINDKTITLKYTEEDAIVQGTATKAISVQPYLFASFNGDLTLTPENDFWFSKTTPQIVTQATDTRDLEGLSNSLAGGGQLVAGQTPSNIATGGNVPVVDPINSGNLFTRPTTFNGFATTTVNNSWFGFGARPTGTRPTPLFQNRTV